MINNSVGDKYYKFDEENNLILFRLIKAKNPNTFTAIYNNGEKFTITSEEIDKDKELKKLNPDGYLLFNIVELQDGLKDVVVILYNDNTPCVVCRQNVEDVFSNKINNTNYFYTGISVSQETCPADIEFKMFLACNQLSYSTLVSVYMDDKLDTILSMVPSMNKFDLVLSTLANNVANPTVIGYEKALKDLLSNNNFMYDFRKCFNITPVDFEVVEIDKELIPEQRDELEDLFKVEMFETIVLKYDKDIDLEKIERDYVLISDITEKIYLVAYNKGEYLNRTYKQNIRDKRDAVMMIKLGNKK